ncbi:MAG: sugar ABC transporter permease [Ruminococcaceae bacterium]|nr:sugar ABC transporter permease [Oscillospiraceae bacterium]
MTVRNRFRKRWQAYVLLYPGLLGVLLFFVLPFFVILYHSLVENNFSLAFVGLQNYRDLLQNEAFRLATRNTVRFSAIAVPLTVGVALPVALALHCRLPARGWLRSILLSPLMVPSASVLLVWQLLFDQSGAMNQLLSLFSLPPVAWLRTTGFDCAVVVLLFLWKNLGYNVLLFSAALSHVPTAPLEAARIDGAGAWRRFWYIQWRYLIPTALFVTVLTLANSFKIFREVYLLTGDYPGEGLYMLQHFMNNMFRTLDYQRLSAATAVMTLVITLVLALLLWLEERFGREVEE